MSSSPYANLSPAAKLFFLACYLLAIVGSTHQATAADSVKKEVRLLKRQVEELIGKKNYKEAVEILQKRGSEWHQRYGAKSWPMIEVSSSLADAYVACGTICDKEADAAVLYEKAALVKRELHGEGDPEYASLIEKAADAFDKIAEHKRALPHYKHLVKKVRAGLGEGHEAVKNVQMKLGNCAIKTKSYKVAAKTFSKVLHAALTADDEVHARVSLSVAQANLGKNHVALENAETARGLAEKHFGTTDFRYAKTLNSVAGALERLDRDDDALRFMREARDIAERNFGPQDPTSIQAQRNLEGMQSYIEAKKSRAARK